jgi:hypothetical protein
MDARRWDHALRADIGVLIEAFSSINGRDVKDHPL